MSSFFKMNHPCVWTFYLLSLTTNTSKVVQFCKDKNHLIYQIVNFGLKRMNADSCLAELSLHKSPLFLLSELPLLQVVAIVIACLVSAAILGLLCLFLCKSFYTVLYDTLEILPCSTRNLLHMLSIFSRFMDDKLSHISNGFDNSRILIYEFKPHFK